MAEFIGFPFVVGLKKPASDLAHWRGLEVGMLPIGNFPKGYLIVLPTEGCRLT
jgi:hypothetical protein